MTDPLRILEHEFRVFQPANDFQGSKWHFPIAFGLLTHVETGLSLKEKVTSFFFQGEACFNMS